MFAGIKRTATAVVLAAIVGLAAIPLFVIVSTWLSVPSASVQLVHAASVPDARASQDKPCRPNQLTLFLHLSKLDITNESLELDVSGCVGWRDASLVSARRGPAQTIALVAGLDSTLSLGLNKLNGAPQHLGAVSIPIDGDSRRYPLDVYRTTIPLSIATTSQALYQALTIQVRADPGVGGFDWSFAKPTPAYTFTPNRRRAVSISQPLAVKAARPTVTRLFVLCLVLVPAILIGLAAPVLRKKARTVEGLFGAASIMLAILPIRTVLVPGEIGSLTLVDFVLGTEMALLAAWTAAVFLWPTVTLRDVLRRPHTSGHGGGDSNGTASGTLPQPRQPAVPA